MKYYLGLDVGGTNLAAGVVDEAFRLLSKVSCPSGAGRQMEEIVADMAAVSQKAVRKKTSHPGESACRVRSILRPVFWCMQTVLDGKT